MKRPHWIPCRFFALALVSAWPASAAELILTQNGSATELSLDAEPPFHSTEAEVTDADVIDGVGFAVRTISSSGAVLDRGG